MRHLILILFTCLTLPVFGQLTWREATTAEMAAGTAGQPVAVTPRRMGLGISTPSLNSSNYVNNFNTNVYYVQGFTPATYEGSNVWVANMGFTGVFSNSVTHGLIYDDGVNGPVMAMTVRSDGVVDFLADRPLTAANDPLVQWTTINGSVVGAAHFITNSITTNILASFEVPSGFVVVCPYTNLSGYYTNSPVYFGPWLGSNYVQQAINALPTYADVFSVGGGGVLVVGINYVPAPLVFTNIFQPQVRANIKNFCLRAEAPLSGALVCVTNPCIRFNSSQNQVTFEIRNLIIASLTNQTTNVFELNGSVGKAEIANNWFGLWDYMTNNQVGGNLVGLTPPTTGQQILKRNLVAKFAVGASDNLYVHDNSFLGMAGAFFSPDHGSFDRNFFSFCADTASGHSDWPTNSLYSLRASVYIGNNVNDNFYFHDNYFYDCNGYATSRSHGVVMNDGFEQTNGYYYCIGANGNKLSPINPNYQGMLGSVSPTISVTLGSVSAFSDPDTNPLGGQTASSTNATPYYRFGNTNGAALFGAIDTAAPSGFLGEIVTNGLASATMTNLTTLVPTNVCSISLTAGDWDVDGVVGFKIAATTTNSLVSCGITTTTASMPASDSGNMCQMTLTRIGGSDLVLASPTARINVGVTTTVFLTAQATFATSTEQAYGYLRARRVR